MKNAIHTNGRNNQQQTRSAKLILLLSLFLAALVVQPAFAQKEMEKYLEENLKYAKASLQPREFEKALKIAEIMDTEALPLQKAAVKTTDKDLEKILPPEVKKYILAFKSLMAETKQLANDQNITETKKQKLGQELQAKSNNIDEELNKTFNQGKGNIPVSLPGVKIFDFAKYNKDMKFTIFGKPSPIVASYLLGKYDGMPVYARFYVTNEFSENADRGIYDIDGLIMRDTSGGMILGKLGMRGSGSEDPAFLICIEVKSAKKTSSNWP